MEMIEIICEPTWWARGLAMIALGVLVILFSTRDRAGSVSLFSKNLMVWGAPLPIQVLYQALAINVVWQIVMSDRYLRNSIEFIAVSVIQLVILFGSAAIVHRWATLHKEGDLSLGALCLPGLFRFKALGVFFVAIGSVECFFDYQKFVGQ